MDPILYRLKNKFKTNLAEQNLASLALGSWLFTAGLFQLIFSQQRDYLTLQYAGLAYLAPFVLLFVLLLASSFYSLKTSRDSNGFFFIGWHFFSLTLLLHQKSSSLILGLFFLNLLSLYLAASLLKTVNPSERAQPYESKTGPSIKPNSRKETIGNLDKDAGNTPPLKRNSWRILFRDPFFPRLLSGINLLSNLLLLGIFKLDGKITSGPHNPLSSWPVILFAILALSLLFFWLIQRFSPFHANAELKPDPLQRKVKVIYCLLGSLFVLLVSVPMVAKSLGLNTPTYDFNLFVQMFHSMDQTGLPMTTLERNLPLSHFKVHISPIYYLLLPFFKLLPTGETLEFLQTLVVASGLTPLLFLLKERRANPKLQILAGFLFVLSTPYITSNFYDLHENAFLVPLLFWLLWALEKNHKIFIALFALATLLIKEDAALYLWVIALYYGWAKKRYKVSLALFFFSGVYFLWALSYLKTQGTGAMTGRFEDLISIPKLSLASVPISLFHHPGFILSKIFTPEKIPYLLQMLLPLGALPLLQRNLSRVSLLGAFLLMNLMVSYPYQSDIRFQYNYGSYTLLFFSAILLLLDWQKEAATNPKPRFRHGLLALAMASGLVFTAFHLSAFYYYPVYYLKNQEELNTMKSTMDAIPKDASVLASPFLTGYLADRSQLYDIEYNVTKEGSFTKTDYIVLDYRKGYEPLKEIPYEDFFKKAGYQRLPSPSPNLRLYTRPKNPS